MGDFRVDLIASSSSDVTLWALQAIVDAEDDPVSLTTPDPISPFTMSSPTTGTDVRGVNITMYAGLGGVAGGIGSPDNWLEIDVDVLNGSGATLGVLNAFDTAVGDSVRSPGIFLVETNGSLHLDTVDTVSDVALRTVNGSILDARNGGLGDDAWNIRGRSVDLFAGGGSIGTFGNDLEIDSLVAGLATPDDVGLEASGSIYLTETDGTLRLVWAMARDGDIRLTVRESSDLDEDLVLKGSGSAYFGEIPPLSPFDVPIGTIFAGGLAVTSGNVTLRVGDNINTHANSRIWATHDIVIFGDWMNLDPGSALVFAATSPPATRRRQQQPTVPDKDLRQLRRRHHLVR